MSQPLNPSRSRDDLPCFRVIWSMHLSHVVNAFIGNGANGLDNWRLEMQLWPLFDPAMAEERRLFRFRDLVLDALDTGP
jgi:hypothetical protein